MINHKAGSRSQNPYQSHEIKNKKQQRLKLMDRYYGARPTNQDLPELTTDWVSDRIWFQKQGRGRLLLNSVAEKKTTLPQLPFPE